jgi:alcohol dehydrogenase (cytochrome c)
MRRVLLLSAAFLCSAAAFGQSPRQPQGEADWPSYNRSLTSERFSVLNKITPGTIAGLKVVCSFDTGEQTSFQSGPVMTAGALFFTTATDTLSIDPRNCRLNWRAHETYKPASDLNVNRGAAYLDGRVFRGLLDGRVVAYDAQTGKRLWETQIGRPERGESVPGAPIAWNGMVFIGNAGGDLKGGQGRVYALDSETGKVVWKFDLVPQNTGAQNDGNPNVGGTWQMASGIPISGGGTWTSFSLDPGSGLLYVPAGNPAPDFVPSVRQGENLYTDSLVVLDARSGVLKQSFKLVAHDFHDYDIATAPSLFTTRGGKRLLAEAGKDGRLYGLDRATGREFYRTPITTIANDQAPLRPEPTRFCPGTQGGAEWNGAAYDPQTNLIYTGGVDWCTTVRLGPLEALKSVKEGQPFTGSASDKHPYGIMDPPDQWGGWLTATDADSGAIKWRYHTPTPLLGGVLPTAGGLVIFGDMAGRLYALGAEAGEKIWDSILLDGGAIAGGIITYRIGGRQYLAVASGMVSPIWPTKKVTAKLVILGL